jgi:hypothetical protein
MFFKECFILKEKIADYLNTLIQLKVKFLDRIKQNHALYFDDKLLNNSISPCMHEGLCRVNCYFSQLTLGKDYVKEDNDVDVVENLVPYNLH